MLEIEKDVRFAYLLEEQMLAVVEAQETGQLLSQSFTYHGYVEVSELQVPWIILKAWGDRLSKYDCDIELLDSLKKNSMLKKVYVEGERPDLCFGRPDHIIAAILHGNTPLYKSPMFDLKAYLGLR